MAQSYKVTRKELDDWLPRGLDHSHEKWFDPDVHRPVQEIYKGLWFRCEDYKRALNSQNPDQPTITFYHRAVEALWSDVDAGSVLQDEWPNGPKLSMVGAEEGAPSQRATMIDSISDVVSSVAASLKSIAATVAGTAAGTVTKNSSDDE